MVADKIEREVTIDAPVERVWELITQAEHLGTWFGDAGAEIDLRPGGAMTLRWEQYGEVRGRVERVEPTSLFAFRWATGQREDPEEGHSTLVEFALAPQGDGTRLRVVESGFQSLDIGEDGRRRRFDDNVEGWGTELGHLAEHARRVAA